MKSVAPLLHLNIICGLRNLWPHYFRIEFRATISGMSAGSDGVLVMARVTLSIP